MGIARPVGLNTHDWAGYNRWRLNDDGTLCPAELCDPQSPLNGGGGLPPSMSGSFNGMGPPNALLRGLSGSGVAHTDLVLGWGEY